MTGGLWIAVYAGLAIGRAVAQPYGDFSGFLFDPSGLRIAGAAVSAVNEETGLRRATFSQPDGRYAIASLQPGGYKITVRKENFRTVIRFGVKLGVGETVRADFTLPVGDVREFVTVEGVAPALNMEDTAVATVTSRDRFENLPVKGRGLLSLLEFSPGTVVTPATRGEPGQFTANGQRPNAHYFTVDGVSANTGVSAGGVPAQCTGGSLPGMTAFGSLHGMASLEALDEFRVQTSTSGAAFGRLPGAQVSLSTRTGSNELHASLFENFRHEELAANDWFANRYGSGRAPMRMNHFGGTAGGTIRRDRIFFFAAYEHMRLRQPFSWRGTVPADDFRRSTVPWVQTLLRLYPSGNGAELTPELDEWTASTDRPAGMHSGSLRMDAAVTQAITVFARY